MNEPARTTDSPAPVAKRSRRMRWSLRVLLVLVGVIAIGLAWVSYEMRVGYMHQEVANYLLEHGGKVKWKRYERQNNPNRPSSDDKEIPAWIHSLGADPIFWRIDEVFFFNDMSPEELDAAVDHVCRLGSVRHIECHNPAITEAHLIRLVEQVDLDLLSVYKAPIKSGPLPWLRDTKLKRLSLARTSFSDEAIDDLPLSLKWFDARHTDITDEGLEKFLRLTNLEKLILRRTPTRGEAIEEVRQKMPWCDIDWAPKVDHE